MVAAADAADDVLYANSILLCAATADMYVYVSPQQEFDATREKEQEELLRAGRKNIKLSRRDEKYCMYTPHTSAAAKFIIYWCCCSCPPYTLLISFSLFLSRARTIFSQTTDFLSLSRSSLIQLLRCLPRNRALYSRSDFIC